MMFFIKITIVDTTV